MPNTKRPFLWSVFFAFLGCALIYSATGFSDIGLSSDSISYLGCADQLAAGRGFTCFDGAPLVQWPPLYPLLLSAFVWLGLPVGGSVVVLNMFSWCALIGLLTAYLNRLLDREAVLVWCLVCVVFSYPLLSVFVMACTEPLFILLVLGFLYVADRLVEEVSFRSVLWLALITSVALLLRYAGLSLLFSGWVVLTLGCRNVPVVKRVRFWGFYTLISLVPLLLWLFRNHMVSDSFTGSRFLFWRSLSFYIWRFADIFTGWFLPMQLPWWLRTVLLLAVLVVAILLLLKEMVRGRFLHLVGRVAVPGSFVVVYSLLHLLTAWVGASDDASQRLLSPLFVPLVLVAGVVCEFFFFGIKSNRFLRLAVIVLLLGGWGYSALRTAKYLRQWHAQGVDCYNRGFWDDSPTLAWLKANELDGLLFSSDPFAVYYFAGIPARQSAHRRVPLRAFVAQLSADETNYLIWFQYRKGFYLYDLFQLQTRLQLTPLRTFEDGVVYRIEK